MVSSGSAKTKIVGHDVGRPHFVRIRIGRERADYITLGHDPDGAVGPGDDRDTDVEPGQHRGERPQGQPLVDRDRAARHDFADRTVRIGHDGHFLSVLLCHHAEERSVRDYSTVQCRAWIDPRRRQQACRSAGQTA